MPVVPEQVLLDLLSRSLRLSQEILPQLSQVGSQPVPAPLIRRYSEIVEDLHRQKRNDSVLSDESWEWIWEIREGMNHLQMYGRLAWLNYNLFDLL